MGIRLNPVPVPVNFPRPSVRVRLFSGEGVGGPKHPRAARTDPYLYVLQCDSILFYSSDHVQAA
jgi:hypothetical protein